VAAAIVAIGAIIPASALAADPPLRVNEADRLGVWPLTEVGSAPQSRMFSIAAQSEQDITGVHLSTDGPFSIDPTYDCDGTLISQAGCAFWVRFEPTEAGEFDGRVIATADGGVEVSTPVHGSAYAAGDEPPEGTDVTPPVVDSFYIEGISRLELDKGRMYGWPRSEAHDAEGGITSPFEMQAKAGDGPWTFSEDEYGAMYFPTGVGQLRVRVIDEAGNASAWKVIPLTLSFDDVSRTAPSTSRVQSFSGTWAKQTASGPYKRTLVQSTATGAKSKVTATASRFALIVRRTTDGGRIAIYVDGKKDRELSLQSVSGTRDRSIIWQKWFGSAKKHVVEVRTVARPANHRKVLLDAWVIQR